MMRAIAAALAALVAFAGCGGDEPRNTAQRPAIDDEQLARVARVLLLDSQDGGARFRGVVPVPDGDEALRVRGVVDWRRTRGRARFEPSSGPPRAFYWTADVVLGESRRGDGRWIATRPGPIDHPVDATFRLLSALASDTIDNVAALRDQGVHFVRRDAVDGAPVEVFRLPRGSVTYWIGSADGRLRRVDADLPALGGVATFVFSDRGAKRVRLPDRSHWADGE